jgi:hypothetical protein
MWKRVNTLLERISAHLDLLTAFGVGGVVSVIMGWAAHVTEQLRPYAPLSWVLAAALGALMFSALYWFICKGRNLWILATINRTFHIATPPKINRLKDTFQKQSIDISQLITPFDRIIKGKTFIDCDLIAQPT